MKRLLWLDISKGLAIFVVVYFHFYKTYFEHGVLPPPDWTSLATGAVSFLRLSWLNISDLGFHAVGVFIILSGWALAQSTVRRATAGPVNWPCWYRSRLLRLYPMYWVAHLVYLVSPFVARFEQVDGRIVLSLLGLRFVNIGMNFYYLNAAWWYFGMLIQFYLIFPLLFWSLRKFGPLKFLLIACAIGFLTRYLLLVVYQQNGMWIQGGCALCRLPEFALGMALGIWADRSQRLEKFLLNGVGLVVGLLLYPAALQLYHNGLTYVFVDFATAGCAFFVIVGVAGTISHFSGVAKILGLLGTYSYGLYLIHQPYVIWLGLRIREQPISIFLLIAALTVAILSVWGAILEKATNTLVNKTIALAQPRPIR
ncbi:MAG TPA: acyltransferase [Chthoniobacterales bacterium]|nr:acyltransferase [Chthoniobacterales bacterium]